MDKAVIFCAPSGSGKTTIVKHLLSEDERLMFSISACTRQKRNNEIHGKDYYFLDTDTFKQKINQNEFLEYEEVYGGKFYGTLLTEIERIWALNKVVVFDVDVVGGLRLKEYFGNKALAIFVKPPSVATLEKRLRHRSTETEETLKMRVSKAIEELTYEQKFDKILLNDVLEIALDEAKDMVNDFLNN